MSGEPPLDYSRSRRILGKQATWRQVHQHANEMREPVRIPRDLFARLMAAIETPGDLSDDEVKDLLSEADRHFPYEVTDDG